MVARSEGVIAPASLPSLRRTSCSSAASSSKSIELGCGLQSEASFFFTVLIGSGGGAGGTGGGLAAGAADSATGALVFGSSHAVRESNTQSTKVLVVFMARASLPHRRAPGRPRQALARRLRRQPGAPHWARAG